MLFFTSGRPKGRPSSLGLGSWLADAPSGDAEAAMKDAVALLQHAGDDISRAAREIGTEASREIRANVAAASAEAKRQIVADAKAARAEAQDQISRNVKAARAEAKKQFNRNVKAARAEAKRQVNRNVKAARAGASAVPGDLIPAGRDVLLKSVEKLVPGRRKRARRRSVMRVVAVLAATGLALLGVQMLMLRRSSRPTRRSDEATGGERPSQAAGQLLSAVPPPDPIGEPAVFDRDAGIRAASEGMEPPDPLTSPSSASEIADGT